MSAQDSPHIEHPITIVIENSSLCRAHCIMCPREKVSYGFQMMNMEVFKKAADEAVALGFSDFDFCAFGDPLLDTHLEDRLKYIKGKANNVKIAFATTGDLLYGKNLDLVCEYLDTLKISNYGFTKQSYESVHRGALKYENVKKNIDEYFSRKKRPFTIMTFLDLPENHNDLEDWKNYYQGKADRIDIWKLHNWGGFLDGGREVSKDVLLPCRRALNLDNLIIRADGRVSMCCFDIDSKMILGDIKQNTLSEIMHSARTLEIQNIHKQQKILSSDLPCRGCDQIRDRKDALIWTSDSKMQTGKYSLFVDDT